MLNEYKLICLYCGRKYIVSSIQVGMVKKVFTQHQSACKRRTPSQRVSMNKKDEERWRLQKPKCRIENDWEHKGLISKFSAIGRKRTKIVF